MRVLKRFDEPWVARVRCEEGCLAQLEVLEEDLKLFHYFGKTRAIEYLSVRCPHCGNVLQDLGIPNRVAIRWHQNHPKQPSLGEHDSSKLEFSE